MLSNTWSRSLTLGLLALSGVRSVKLSKHAQSIFDESMIIPDQVYDSEAGYLHNFYYPLGALDHDCRSSVWYATGLLQRNRGCDAEDAIKIIRNVIGGQQKNVSAQWYGDYQSYPEQPSVGSAAYPPVVCSPD